MICRQPVRSLRLVLTDTERWLRLQDEYDRHAASIEAFEAVLEAKKRKHAELAYELGIAYDKAHP